jgi:hypothetical protein
LGERLFLGNRWEEETHTAPSIGVERGLGKIEFFATIYMHRLDAVEVDIEALHHDGNKS